MSRMWYYTLAVISLWIASPEIRRVYDWNFGFSEVSPIAILPLIAVFPHIVSLLYGGGWKRLSRPIAIAAILWITGFTYALVLGLVYGNGLPALYAYANFVLPIAVGLWMAADASSFDVAIVRVTRFLFAAATAVSLYGMYQFARLPAWDAYWLQSIAHESRAFGLPMPYEVRVFSVLNSPGTLGAALAITLIASLPFLSIRKPWVLIQAVIWLVTFGLTRDRTGWLVLAVGLVVYLAIARGRLVLVRSAGVLALILVSSVGIVTFYSGNVRVLDTMTSRLDSLQDLSNDVSVIDRERLYEDRLGDLAVAPFGQGLGLYGTATKLSDSNRTTDLDSGVLARFVEMGFPGALMMAASLALVAMTSLLLIAEARKRGDERACAMMAVALATEAGILVLEVSLDVTGVGLLYLWILVALALRAERGRTRELSLRLSPVPRLA
jgi:putative inorganic carbon (hco3(-)) transporter